MKTKYPLVLALAILLMAGIFASGTRAQEGTTDESVFTHLQSIEVTAQGARPISQGETSAAAIAERVITSFSAPSAASVDGTMAPGAMSLTGTQPWIALMCKFSDFADEPHDLAWYQGMYSDTFPGLGHYFNEASFGQMSLSGSTAAGWFTLPNNRAHYTWPDGTLKGTAAMLDCITAADPTVNFVPYDGIAVMVNTNLGNVFTAGALLSTLDGEQEERMITAAPLAVYDDVGNVVSAMSNALHMHPSWGDYGGVLQYDVWNAVGSGLLNCSPSTAYGCTLQHADMVNRDHMDWVLPERKYTATTTGDHAITLQQTAQPPAGDYLMAEIPLFIIRDYGRLVIEARRQVGYDAHLPGNAVIIHRDYYIDNQPLFFAAPNLIEVGSGGWSHSWAMWTVGETYVDADNRFEVSVDAATATGFDVTLTRLPAAQIIVQNEFENSITTASFGYDTSYAGAISVFGDSALRSTALDPAVVHSVTPTTQPGGWVLVDSDCDDGSLPTAINLSDGERVTCTFTYHRQPSDIIIRKVTNPAGTGQSFSFSSPTLPSFQLQGGGQRTFNFLNPGTYSVSEIDIPAGWELSSATCDDGSLVTAIALDYGDTITCTFTNNALPGRIIVQKTTIPTNTTPLFTFDSSYGADFQLHHGESNDSGPLPVGTYSVQEINLPTGWVFDGTTCSDFSDETAINVGPGETVTCTFYNRPPGFIVVRTMTSPSNPTPLFNFTTDYGAPFGLHHNESNTSPPLPGGSNNVYEVTEGTLPAGWVADGANCTGGSFASIPSFIRMNPGETVTCTFLYEQPPPPDPFEPNNTPAQATAIAYGQTKTGGRIDPAGDHDYFTFSGSAGHDITATVLAQVNGSSLDSVLTLFAANGTTVLAEEDDSIGLDSQIVYILPNTGTYYLRVRDFNELGGTQRTYDLRLEADVLPAPTAAFTGTPLSGAAPLLVSFTDQSTGSPTSWAWAFGDGGTSNQRHPTRTYTTPGVYTVTLTATNAQGSDGETKTNYITVTAPPATPSVYVVSTTAATVGGVAAKPQDILFRNGTTGTWSMYFDGSDVGVTKPIAGFAHLPNGDLLLALKANQSLPNVGAVTTWDVVRFIPTSLGATTDGAFAWYFDGSDVNLTTSGEKIDALDVLPDGRVLISTLGAFAVPKPGGGTLKAQDEDVVALTGTFGATTTGTWSLNFDGTAVSGLGVEDVSGVQVNSATGDVYITVLGASNVGGVSGNGKEIFKLAPSGGGFMVTKYWNGASFGFNLIPGALELP